MNRDPFNFLRDELRAIVSFIIVLLLALFLASLNSGCQSVTKHQKGGRTVQNLSPSVSGQPIQPALQDWGVPAQSMEQPENPQGESKQHLARVVTTVDPATGVITSTTEKAETTIGGSQDLAKIVKEKVGADHLRNLSLALAMGIIAWVIRREWPIVATVLAIGAVIVAFFGIGWALGFGGFGLGALVAYYVARSQLPTSPFP